MAVVESNRQPGVMVCNTSNAPLHRHLAVYDKEMAITFYNIERSPGGFALLLGNDRLTNASDSTRLPVKKDLELMQDVLKGYGWHVSSPFAYDPHMKQGDCNSLMQTLVGNLDAYSCFMFYYSGHGTAKGLLLSDGSCEPYADIVNNVSKMESLRGKPKIFIFDSCRIPSSHSKFFIEISKHHNEYESQSRNYPPPDTLICFSANEGMESFSHDDYGSFYTEQLARRLRHFGERLTLTEIITLTNDGVIKTAQKNKEQQQPVIYSTLNKLLVLNSDRFRNGESSVFRTPKQPSIPVDVVEFNNAEFVFLKPQRKGAHSSEESALHGSDVVTDVVKRGKRPSIQFKKREDVLNNLPRLGQGISVFICYAPDPESPYHDPEDRQGIIVRNQIYITHLTRDLERLGFTVISDLHLGETQPRNWLQWYVSRMELCDYLIMVCSPAFKELFSCERPQFQITDERTSWFLAYRNVMYADIAKEVNESPTHSKFLPVILDEQYLAENSVPALFRMAPLYLLGSDGHRKFNYDNMIGDYERLVCRMAGIDRMKMEKPINQGVVPVAPPFSQGHGVRGALSGVRSKPRRGYKSVPWQPSAKTTASKPNAQLPPERPNFSSQVQPPLLISAVPTFNGHVSQRTNGYAYAYPTSPPAQPPPQHKPASLVQPLPPPPSSLPNKPPARPIILWLCERITNWKMIARFLGFDGSEIERISIDHDSVVEQRFQMFDSWQRHETREYSYRTLGDVLWNSESNRHLYGEFYQKAVSTN